MNTDSQWMQLALDLAKRGQYTARPNPCVGCVLVKDNQLLAQGWHEIAGEPHAEVYALQQAGQLAQGATCYVTLEPCAHHGRTPPCCEALVKAGVARVIIAATDPNPVVAGRGIAYLQANGIEVVTGVLNEEAKYLNRAFMKRMCYQKPWLTLKLAMTLDAKLADFQRKSQWITSDVARADVQQLRARHDAIMTGIGTVLADDPSLTVRDLPKDLSANLNDKFKQPLRVVLDSQGRMPVNAKMLIQSGDTLIFSLKHNELLATKKNVSQTIVSQNAQDRLDLVAVLMNLAQREINSVLVECGSELASALLEENLVDELVIYYAPKILGQGMAAFSFQHALPLAAAKQFNIQEALVLGNDVKLVLLPS